MTVRKYMKLEISISSLKYFQTERQKKNKFVRSVFGRIYGPPICLWFYLTFIILHIIKKIPTNFFVRRLLSFFQTSSCDRFFFLNFVHFELLSKALKNRSRNTKICQSTVCTVDILSGFGMLFFPVPPAQYIKGQ